MKFSSISANTLLFIDANIFIYHFTNVSQEYTDLLLRYSHQEIDGITTVAVCLEVLHRLMCLEAVSKGLVSPGNVVKKLQTRPEIVKLLSDYNQHVSRIAQMGVSIIPVDHALIEKSAAVRAQTGLLVNDSLILTAMQEFGITALATNDDAFDTIAGIIVYKPSDV
jgi:predicted nucleic acid-binding protein